MALSEGRRLSCCYSPMLWALTYFSHHLASDETDGEISFSLFHLEAYERAKQWTRTDIGPMEIREADISARGSGKSTVKFIILPTWALAYGHRHYVAAFADSASQAEQHLTSVKSEFDHNELLRMDFPDLCTPAVRHSGVKVSDHRSMYVAKSGAIFTAKGIDSSVLGAKVGNRRPDLILFDDIEPDASNYSAYQKEKRLATIVNAILPMNDRAVVQFVGTTTMPGSIIHDLVKTVLQPGADAAPWVRDENIRVFHYPALVTDALGNEQSAWPQRWSLEYLQSIQHTRSFRLNMQNDPMAADGDYWTADDIRYGTLPALTHQVLSIDPAVTATDRSDFTAIALVGFYAPERKCVVRDTWNLRIPPGEALRARVLAILEQYPDIRGILVERNQGGQVWESVFHDMPVSVKTVHNSVPKPVRAAGLLNHYQARRVIHEKKMHEAEGQLISFPKGAYDDLVDAIGNGVEVFLGKKKKTGMTQMSYV